MARKVFYSFHFKRDVWRAGQVRNSNAISDDDEYGVIDAAEWEKIEREGDAAIQRWINGQMKSTSVTVVLIGAETAERDWVKYEIEQSWKRGNALLGLRIHGMKNQDGKTDVAGPNPFENFVLSDGVRLSDFIRIYDWQRDDGRANLGDWVEEAYQQREDYEGATALTVEDASVLSAAVSKPAIITDPAKPWHA